MRFEKNVLQGGLLKTRKYHPAACLFLGGKFHPGGSNIEDAANSKSSLQRLYLSRFADLYILVGGGWQENGETVR